MKILSKDETKAFLTKGDLEKLLKLVVQDRLEAVLHDTKPVITVRGQNMLMFNVLQMLGDL